MVEVVKVLSPEVGGLLADRVPVECPFCRGGDGVSWDEFRVLVGDVGLVAGGVWRRDVDVACQVWCTRCDEEVRPEDVSGGE